MPKRLKEGLNERRRIKRIKNLHLPELPQKCSLSGRERVNPYGCASSSQPRLPPQAELGLEGRAGVWPTWKPWQGRGSRAKRPLSPMTPSHGQTGSVPSSLTCPAAPCSPGYARFLGGLFALGLALEVSRVERKKHQEGLAPSRTLLPTSTCPLPALPPI